MLKNLSLLNGYDGIFLGESKINYEILVVATNAEIRVIATKIIGYDHIEYAKELGIKVCNSSIERVVDFTVMLMRLMLRHYKKAEQVNDYSL